MESFTLYETPKKGVFNQCTSEYRLPGGWVQKPVEAVIIGETEDIYVTRQFTSEMGRWVGKVVINYQEEIYVGFHKSRFVSWKNHQLAIF